MGKMIQDWKICLKIIWKGGVGDVGEQYQPGVGPVGFLCCSVCPGVWLGFSMITTILTLHYKLCFMF